MSYQIEYKCDGLECSESQDTAWLETPRGWHEHDGFHYCPKCWKEIEPHLEEEDD